MRRRPIVFFLAVTLLGAAVAAPPATAGKLDSVTDAVKSLVDKDAGGKDAGGGNGHAQGAADLVKGKTGALGKAGNLLGKDKLDLLKKKKGVP